MQCMWGESKKIIIIFIIITIIITVIIFTYNDSYDHEDDSRKVGLTIAVTLYYIVVKKSPYTDLAVISYDHDANMILI